MMGGSDLHDGDVELVTFGCRLNAAESEIIGQRARAAGLVNAVIVNTCAVTGEAERQARQAIRRAKRSRPDATMIVTGCAAQIDPAAWSAMPEVDRIVANDRKLFATSYGAVSEGETDAFGHEPVRIIDSAAAQDLAGHLVVGGTARRVRAFLQVQNGCDHRCTFCIIPFGRGPSRSVPLGPIAARARALIAAGYKEIVLTGVDLTSYGDDLPGRPSLGSMVRRLLDVVPELPCLRLSSLDPAEFDDALWQLIADEPRLLPHLHLSLQAGDDLILKRMKRRHSRRGAVDVAARARRLRPDIALGADLIAGFPTETDAMARNTLDLSTIADSSTCNVFPYSSRPGTGAARMPQVPVDLRRARAARLREAGERSLARYLAAQVGREMTVLVEQPGRGRTGHYAQISLPRIHEPGSLVTVRVAASNGQCLIAEGASA